MIVKVFLLAEDANVPELLGENRPGESRLNDIRAIQTILLVSSGKDHTVHH
jgi:hypothetical protein